MTTKLQRLRKRQRFNRHVEQLTDKKAKDAHRKREHLAQLRKKKRQRQKRSEHRRLIRGYVVERAKEAQGFVDAPPHPFQYEEQKARVALAKAAARIDQYGRPEQPAF